jgi:hypothetical protein
MSAVRNHRWKLVLGVVVMFVVINFLINFDGCPF